MRGLDFLGLDGGRYRLAHVGDPMPEGGGWRAVPTSEAAVLLGPGFDAGPRTTRLAATWTELRSPVGWSHESSSDAAHRWVLDELRSPAGALVLWCREPPSLGAPTPRHEIEAVSLADLAGPLDERTWVAFRLVDLHGEPIADARYEITLSDGSLVDGTTNADGEARHDGIVAGGCTLSFPDLPEDYWQHEHNAA